MNQAAVAVEPRGNSMNIAILTGTLAAGPRVTELPNGSTVHNFELKTVNDDDRHDVPVAWHDPRRPPTLREGDAVVVVGAVRRRWFRAGAGSQSRTEVLASSVARDGSAGATRAIRSALNDVRKSESSE
jgi:single-stranded DNA-binding protein